MAVVRDLEASNKSRTLLAKVWHIPMSCRTVRAVENVDTFTETDGDVLPIAVEEENKISGMEASGWLRS